MDLMSKIWWLRRANCTANRRTNPNRQNTSKLRKHLHQFDNPRTAFKKSTSNTENTTEVFPGDT